MRYVLVLVLAFCPTVASADALRDSLMADVGQGSGAHLHMHYEVTFMKIDVADVDVWLPPSTAATLSANVSTGEDGKPAKDAIAGALLAADPLTVDMTIARDAGLDRFLKGSRKSLERARDSNAITEAELEDIWTLVSGKLASLEERGLFEGDRVTYRVDGDTVRTVIMSHDGNRLLDFTHESDARARGIRGSFFGAKSKFRDKLIRSLTETS